MYLLDSDVIIWHLRRRPGVVRLVEQLDLEGRLGVSAMTRLEVRAGMKPGERQATENLLSKLETYPVTGAIADSAADFLRDYRTRGITLGQVDAVIGATAIDHSLVLVTMNPRHYPMPGLALRPVPLDR